MSAPHTSRMAWQIDRTPCICQQ